MASPPISGAGADRSSSAASPGRGGRGGGGGRSQGRGGGGSGSGSGRGRSNGKIIPNANVGRRNNNDSMASNPSENSNGGRSHGGGRRHFSARGGGGGGAAGRGNSGERGSAASTSLDQSVVVEHSVKQEVKAMTDQDVLIAFGPFVRSGNAEATNIHKQYLSNSRQQEFINNARLFLIDQRSRTNMVDVIEDPCNNKQAAPHDVGAFSANDALPQDNDTLTIRLMSEPPTGVLMQTTSDALGMEDRCDSSNNNSPIPLPSSVVCPPPGILSVQPQQPLDQNSSLNKPSLPPGMLPPMRPVTAVEATPPPKTQPISSILPARAPPQGATTTTPGKPTKARRTQTRCEEQPGRLLANQRPAAAFNNNQDTSIVARPRSHLVARWILPLSYLRNRALRRFEEQKALGVSTPQNLTIRDALKDLAVGLFRRGAMDSGSQSSIVTKEILASNDNTGQQQQSGRPPEDYFFNVDQKADSVFGEVPFYAPRTPGNVVFRLYFEDEPHVTLATGPCIHVIPADGDVDSVLRFILSNFKSKTSNGISSMTSLASVFELFSTRQNERYFDAAGRVAWGCICESRKLVEQAGATYIRKKIELEAELEAERIKATLPDLSSLGFDDKTESSDGPVESTKLGIKNEKSKASEASEAKSKLPLERYNNERKWREVQLVYASILKAALNNSTIHVLLKRELLSKMKLEYELWCPLTESFAPNPFAKEKDDNESQLSIDLSSCPNSGNALLKCKESRHNLQKEVLGFIPQSRPILPSAKEYRWKRNNRNLFKELSSAMTEIYQNEYAVSDQVTKRRENVRASIELIVSNSGEFPVGTKVVVFGSSANGFGSPISDLDLCLQVPSSATNFTKEANGVEAMSNLATKLSEAGLTDVDTVRLTARIPIVKFNVPYNDDGKEILVECDLSLQNPLACLNTSLLNAYSAISPTTCVLASIINRWAKNRGINNPSQYTLSSYGYVIMLTYFLTSCDFDKNGFVRENANAPSPILPNLQLVDPLWAQNPSLGPYRENAAKSKTLETMICHPTEANYFVNSYFYRSGLEGLKRFSSESHFANTATGALLASFFHYFAYDFDYSKRVVSLNMKHSTPPLEKEVKAEEDGWSLFRQGLAIEDPFELFYDVAHVVKASNFQHIRREFSLAYTKIVNAAYTDGELPTGREIIDSICEPVEHVEE